ncbi:MAG: hypothetical protein ACKOXK_03835 [Chakrabartia sp.]
MRSDEVLARAEAALQRHGGRSRMQQRALSRLVHAGRVKAKRIAWLTVGFLVGVPLFAALVTPIGFFGFLLAVMAYFGLALASLILPATRAVPVTDLPGAPLKALPLSTEAWLAGQRRALPPPAQRIADQIGLKLEQIAPQLAVLDEREPAAHEIRRLIADELPELVNGYLRVPGHLRRDGMNGLSPDRQLVDGLGVVESELQRMSEQLASGDLHKLATQGRYLELKYQGEP